jgi:hypothetical protein
MDLAVWSHIRRWTVREGQCEGSSFRALADRIGRDVSACPSLPRQAAVPAPAAPPPLGETLREDAPHFEPVGPVHKAASTPEEPPAVSHDRADTTLHASSFWDLSFAEDCRTHWPDFHDLCGLDGDW